VEGTHESHWHDFADWINRGHGLLLILFLSSDSSGLASGKIQQSVAVTLVLTLLTVPQFPVRRPDGRHGKIRLPPSNPDNDWRPAHDIWVQHLHHGPREHRRTTRNSQSDLTSHRDSISARARLESFHLCRQDRYPPADGFLLAIVQSIFDYIYRHLFTIAYSSCKRVARFRERLQ